MRAYALDHFGEAGSVRDLPAPKPGAGQVLVRVAAAGINPFDAAVVNGFVKDMMEHHFPLVPGIDASGVVEAVGDGGWNVGDEVFAAVGKMYLGEGTFAEHATMSAGTIARRPASVDRSLVAAMPTAGVTALTLLDAVAAADGETLLAIGASGGVGSFLVLLAAERGVRVIGVARGEGGEYMRGLGAADVIDYTAGDVSDALRSLRPNGIDAIVDMVGDKESVMRLSEQLRSGGRVASAAGGADEAALAERDIKAANVQTMVTTERLDELAKGFEDGRLKSPQIESVALDQAAEALARVGSKHVRGKLVIAVS